MNLTADQLKTWLSALRSGEYLQTRVLLVYIYSTPQRHSEYCCMGVAGKVCFNLTDQEMRHIGLLSSMDPKHNLNDVFTDDEEITLSRLNDTYKLTFSQIAAFIEGADEETWNKETWKELNL